jgi:hypothetical protein
MRVKKTIKLLTVFLALLTFGVLGTAWPSGAVKAEDTKKSQNQKTTRQRLRDGSNCTTGNGLNGNTDASNNTNTGNRNRHGNGSGSGGGNGNDSGVDKSRGKGGSK